jgi:hypothetical protein
MGETFTATPLPKKQVNITAEELLNGVVQLLGSKGIKIGKIEYAKEDDGTTEVTFGDVTGETTYWREGRSVFFHVSAKFGSMNTKLGDGPFALKIMATRVAEESQQDLPCKMLFDVVARVNADRSISFEGII